MLIWPLLQNPLLRVLLLLVTSGSLYSPSLSKARKAKIKKAAKRQANVLTRQKKKVAPLKSVEDQYADKLLADIHARDATGLPHHQNNVESEASSQSHHSNSESNLRINSPSSQ